MTDDRMALPALLGTCSDEDLLREMIGYVDQRLMQLDVEGLVGAGHGERGEGREDWRNGYREHAWRTRSGTIPLRVPKLRRGSYFPAFLEHDAGRRKRWRRWRRKPTCRASRPARWTNW